MIWKVKILTLFPCLFPGHLGVSVIGNALKNNIWDLETKNLRDYGQSKHQSIDDYPYGGGAGMVLRCDVLGTAIESFFDPSCPIILMSPSGRKLNKNIVKELTAHNGINVICPRFEGVDARIIQYYNADEISIGDYILSSGDLAAQVLIDACVRSLPCALPKEESVYEESFSIGEYGLLEYPQYTRPQSWQGINVPDVLISGHHENIKKWRMQQALLKTKNNRQDLFDAIPPLITL